MPAPLLTVLIPARNEAHNLETCVRSLVTQSEPGFALGTDWQIVLIDDSSTDDTLPLARRFAADQPGIQVLNAPAWKNTGRTTSTGKNAALWHGVQTGDAKDSKWLLFLDADTELQPQSLHRALTEATRHEVSLLSYSPRQIATGLLQRALLPLIFSELASAYPPRKVNDPSSPVAAANGQFLLVDTAVYLETGGHNAVGANVLEDVALAHRIKRRHRIRLRYAPEAVSARMYTTFAELWSGWTKNLALLFSNTLFLAANRTVDLVLIFLLPFGIAAIPYLATWQKAALGVVWLRVLVRFYGRVKRSNAPFLDCVLSAFALPVFIAMLIRSWQKITLLKRVTWKGREYGV